MTKITRRSNTCEGGRLLEGSLDGLKQITDLNKNERRKEQERRGRRTKEQKQYRESKLNGQCIK